MKSFVVAVLSFFVLLCGCSTPPVEKPPEKTCVPRVVILKGVNFDHDKASLRPESYPILNENLATLKANPRKRALADRKEKEELMAKGQAAKVLQEKVSKAKISNLEMEALIRAV